MYRCHSSHVLCGTIKGRFWIITLCYTVFCRHYIVVVVIIPILILDLLWVECCYYFCHCLHFVTKHTERFPFYKFILIFNHLTNFKKWRTLSIWGNLLFFFNILHRYKGKTFHHSVSYSYRYPQINLWQQLSKIYNFISMNWTENLLPN